MQQSTITGRPAIRSTGGFRGWITRRPLFSFFALAYALSWLAWTPYVLSQQGLGVLDFRIPEVMGDAQLLGLMPGAYVGPLTSAFLITLLTQGRAGLRPWGRRLITWRVGWRWYAFALLVVPATILLGTAAMPGAADAFRLPGIQLLLAYLLMLVVQFFTTGLAEEPGWRDFALPRMQERHGPVLGASLFLGVIWAAWHAPLFLTGWAGQRLDPIVLLEFVGTAVFLSVVITWVFNRAGESVPLIMLLHAGVNNTVSIAVTGFFPDLGPRIGGSTLGLGVLALVVLIATRGRLGHRAPAPKASPTPTEDAGDTRDSALPTSRAGSRRSRTP